MKNHRILFLFIIASHVACNGYSQVVYSDAVVDMTTASFRELRVKPDENIQSIYLRDNWVNGNIEFKSGYVVKDIPINYDLREKILEIKTKDGVKVAPIDILNTFEFDHKIEKHIFIIAENNNIKGLSGVVEVLLTGSVSLYAKPYVKIIKSNYNPALNIGERYDTYVKDETLIIIKGDKVYDVTNLGKKLLVYFDNEASAVNVYVKQNSLSYKDKNDLVKIIKYFNNTAKKL